MLRRHLPPIVVAWSFVLLAALSPQAAAQVTTPEACLGFAPGADYHLATYEQAIACWTRWAKESPRMRLFEMGKTALGRTQYYAVVSSEANLARLDEWRETSRRLTLARGLTEPEAAKLAESGKVVVWIDGGLHASECAPAQQMIQLAYDLITGEDARTRFIRDQVVALLVFTNPDGMTMLADWYQPNVGTPFETSPMPWVYNKYAGHDNNRDGFHVNLVETRNALRLQFQEWFPEIVLNHHQTAPFPTRIFIPPYAEPTNPDVHPLVWRQSNLIGTAMGLAFEAAGQPGAVSRLSFDSFYPGYFTSIPDSHNCPAILTEIALFRYATPREYTVADFPEAYRDLRPGRFYPSPWKGGWWRLGDAVAYALTASHAVLDVAARYRFDFLMNKYRMGRDAIESGRQQPPHGWIIPTAGAQTGAADPGLTATMIDKLLLLGAEVYVVEEAFTDAGVTYGPGTLVVPASQPFGPFVKQMFSKQDYPDLRKYPHLWQNAVGAPVKTEDEMRPYDAAGWTLPLQFGVPYVEMSAPLGVKATRLTTAPAVGGSVIGTGSRYVLTRDRVGALAAVNAVIAARGTAGWLTADVRAGGSGAAVGGLPPVIPRGSFVIEPGRLSRAALAEIAQRHGVDLLVAPNDLRAADVAPIGPLRVGLYRPWTAVADEGWTRLIFEEFGVPYTSLTNDDIRAGGLEARFGAIVLPDQSPASIVGGHRDGSVPPRYAGGLGDEGVAALKRFIEAGGTLVCNGASSAMAIDRFRLPVTDVVRTLSPGAFSIPGSIIRVDYDPAHPVAFGMPSRGVGFFGRSQAYAVAATPAAGQPAPLVVARYPDEPLLLSGYQEGEAAIRGRAAVVEAPVGKGRVVLFGFNVVNRYQTPAVVRLLLNALYDRPAVPASAAGRGER